MKKGIAITGVTLAGAVLIYLVNGIAIQKLWGWFIVTTFDVPSLPLRVAIGIGILVALTAQNPYAKREETQSLDSWAMSLGLATLKGLSPSLFALLVGYIVHIV